MASVGTELFGEAADFRASQFPFLLGFFVHFQTLLGNRDRRVSTVERDQLGGVGAS